MTICMPIIQRDTLNLQKSGLEFRQMQIDSSKLLVTQSLQTLAANNADMESAQAQKLQYLSQIYTQQQSSIESQLKAINNELDGLNKLIDNNIKNDCKLNLLG